MEIDTMDLLFPDKNDELYKRRQDRYFAELHTRLTGGLHPLMVGLLILAFLGNPNSHRQGQFIVITTACLVIIILRGMTIFGEGALRSNVYMTYLVWGVPLLSIAVAIFLLATDRNAFSTELLAKTEALVYRISLRLQPLKALLFGKSVSMGASS